MGKNISKNEYEERMAATMHEIAMEFEDGIEIREIATTHKLTIETIYRILKKYYGENEKQKFDTLLQKQIIKLYEDGLSKSEIGKRFGLASVTKYIEDYYKKSEKVDFRKINEENERIQKQKIKKEKKEVILTQKNEIQEQNKEIIRLYENGIKQKEIAKMFGLKRSTVAGRIHRYYKKSEGSRNDLLDKAIIDGLATGKTKTAIAKEVGKSRTTISRRIERLIEEGKIFPKKETKTTLSKEIKNPLKSQILDDELNNIILKGMLGGKTQEKLAQQIGVSRSTIGYRIKKMREQGIEIPDARKKKKSIKKKRNSKHKRTKNDAMDNKILACIAKKMNKTEIAEIVGLSKSAISCRIKKMKERGINIPETIPEKIGRPKKTENDEIDNIILNELSNGKMQIEIAEELGISIYNIKYKISQMRKRGVNIPKTSTKNRQKVENRIENSKSLNRKKDLHKSMKISETDNIILEELKKGTTQSEIARNMGVSKQAINYRKKKLDMIENQKLAKIIVNLIYTKKATIEQVKIIGDYYGINIEETLNSLDEQER